MHAADGQEKKEIEKLADEKPAEIARLMGIACTKGYPELARMCIEAITDKNKPDRITNLVPHIFKNDRSKKTYQDNLQDILFHYFTLAEKSKKMHFLVDVFTCAGVPPSLAQAVHFLHLPTVKSMLEDKKAPCSLNELAKTYNTGLEEKKENLLRQEMAKLLIQHRAVIHEATTVQSTSMTSLFNTIADKNDVELLRIIQPSISNMTQVLAGLEAVKSKSGDVTDLLEPFLERLVVLLPREPEVAQRIGENYLYYVTSALEENERTLPVYQRFIVALRDAGFDLNYKDDMRMVTAFEGAVSLEKHKFAGTLFAANAERSLVAERKESKRAPNENVTRFVQDFIHHLESLDSLPPFTGQKFFDKKAEDPRREFKTALMDVAAKLNTPNDDVDRMPQLLAAINNYAKALEGNDYHPLFAKTFKQFLKEKLGIADITEISNSSNLSDRIKEKYKTPSAPSASAAS